MVHSKCFINAHISIFYLIYHNDLPESVLRYIINIYAEDKIINGHTFKSLNHLDMVSNLFTDPTLIVY